MKSKKRKRTSHKNEFVKATNTETSEVKFYRNGIDAAYEIGCSHVLVYRALKKQGAQVGGWELEYIPKDDPQCADFKKKEEERIRTTRQSLVEYARDQMLKRKQFVESEKAKRKAEHDSLVCAVRSMVACAS